MLHVRQRSDARWSHWEALLIKTFCLQLITTTIVAIVRQLKSLAYYALRKSSTSSEDDAAAAAAAAANDDDDDYDVSLLGITMINIWASNYWLS